MPYPIIMMSTRLIYYTRAKTVGSFLNATVLLLICICVSSAMWAFLQGVCGDSYVSMSVVLFLYIYALSILRTISHVRFFVCTLIGAIIAYNSTASSILTSLTATDLSTDHIERSILLNKLVSDIQGCFGVIDAEINQASAEITYARFSVKQYSRIVKSCKSVAAVLLAMNTVLNAPESEELFMSPQFQENITSETRAAWGAFAVCCVGKFHGLCLRLNLALQNKSDDFTHYSIEDLETLGREAINQLEKQQPILFESMFRTVTNTTLGSSVHIEAMKIWEQLLQINFYILSAKELIRELSALHTQVHALSKAKQSVRLHVNWYSPPEKVLAKYRSQASSTALSLFQKPLSETFYTLFVELKNWFLSSNSVFAMKAGDVYKQWYVSGSFGFLIIAVSPSLGQTYTLLPLTILGTSIGAACAYMSVAIFGRSSYGHIVFSVGAGLPFWYLVLFSPRTGFLGLLTLLAFGNYICISYANVNNPLFEPPEVTYTNLFRDLNIFYRKLMSTSLRPADSSLDLEDSTIKELRNHIFSELVSCEPLLTYAAAEPRLEGRFQTKSYKDIINCMYELLDRLECVRLCIGDKPFDADVKHVLRSSKLADSRAQLQQTIRLLLHTFSASMLTKLKILPSLPNVSNVRERVINDFVDVLEGIVPLEKERMLETLNSEKWMRLFGTSAGIREVSRTVDKFVPHMKSIFGEAPDIVIDDDEHSIAITDGRSVETFLVSSK
ncbi:hypothetical protein BCR33DRAFT_717121 [Rhizoclosmatium globosum]|uniref:Uncharacterized protein n=1 Tax=Rhizoclosmatium globosum TaxID=329046 RepID=A0A1Y2CAD2_9FUNG|nr:hypothetical protein BCR33DRAFT_717121 [Rhizoclosmatium globosum]|eukprot:ORY43998.1 hypothetical protein BCR33DRAFT_717121 [Rhizoclosmatium globosum]